MFEFAWFKAQKTLTLENNYIIQKFYALRYNENYPVFYHCLPEYNSVVRSTQFKYAIVDYADDKIFIAYKIIQIMTTRQVRIFDRPISYNGSEANEDWLITKLKSLPFIKFVFKENTGGLNSDEACEEYDDYFLDFSVHKIKNRYVHRFNNSKNLSIKITHELSDTEKRQMLDLRKRWTAKRNASQLSLKEFASLLNLYNSSFCFILIYYGDELISTRVIVITKFGYANSLYNFSDNEIVCEGQEQNLIKYQLLKVQNAYIKDILKEFGMTKLYIAGCRPSEHRLIQHKERISDGKIRYYLDNANYTTQQPKTMRALF